MRTTTDTEIGRYLARVRAALADLPDDERDDLLEDLESHLAEVLDEVAADADADPAADAAADPAAEPAGGTLESRLGSPEEYAAELRASAGLAPAARTPRWTAQRRQLAALREKPAVRSTLAFLPELRPGWWVLRGVIVAALLGYWFDSAALAVVLALLAAPASVWLGRRTAAGAWRVGRRRLGALAANAIVAVAGLALLVDLSSTRVVYSAVDQSPSYPSVSYFVESDGSVTNIYPYAKDGTPLHDVLLYDQNGNPLVLSEQVSSYDGSGQLVRRYPYTPDGRAIQHAYPQDQTYQDDSTYPPVVRQQQPPRIILPQFATPTPDPGTGSTPAPTPTTPAPPATGKPTPPRPTASPSPR